MPETPLVRGSVIDLTIEKMTFGEAGLGRYQGLVVFVPFVLAGEIVSVRITELKKDFARAEVIKILSEAPQRRAAPCPYYGQCGGCDWQHMTYAQQIESKKQVVADILKRQRIPWDQKFEILEANSEWNYRNRIQVYDNGATVGFRKKNSHDIVAIESCMLAESTINDKLAALKAENLGRIEFRSEVSNQNGFEQINSEQNRVMINWLTETVKELNPKSILDLYCGSGNLSFPIVESILTSSVVGVESNSDSISKANTLAKEKGLSDRAHFFEMDVDKYLAKHLEKYLTGASSAADLVILDPPRQGAGIQVINDLSKIDSKNIIYISCDPMTWARDLKLLLEADSRWRIVKLLGIDLFPQTHHIEILSQLSRN